MPPRHPDEETLGNLSVIWRDRRSLTPAPATTATRTNGVRVRGREGPKRGGRGPRVGRGAGGTSQPVGPETRKSACLEGEGVVRPGGLEPPTF